MVPSNVSAEQVALLAVRRGFVSEREMAECMGLLCARGGIPDGDALLQSLVANSLLTVEQADILRNKVSTVFAASSRPPSGVRELARKLNVNEAVSLDSEDEHYRPYVMPPSAVTRVDNLTRARSILNETRVGVYGDPGNENDLVAVQLMPGQFSPDVSVLRHRPGTVEMDENDGRGHKAAVDYGGTAAVGSPVAGQNRATRPNQAEHSSPNEDPDDKLTVVQDGTAVSSSAPFVAEPLQTSPQSDDKYMIGKEIGRGGMGIVRIARDLDLGRDVAMKTLWPSKRTDDVHIRALIAEARLAGQLQHPNIIPVYDLGLLGDGSVFYTMRLGGRTHLYDVIRRLRAQDAEIVAEYTLVRLLNILIQVSMALHYAHVRGVVHRDVKPDNVMLGSFGEVQIMDWGIAKVMKHAAHPAFGGRGVIAGTPAYMSPEQARGDYDAIDPRSDVYSLGVMMYEILTLRLPSEVAKEYHPETDAKRLSSIVVPPHVAAPERGVSPALSTICLKAMQTEPTDRYPDARSLWRDVEEYLEGSKERERLQQRAAAEVGIGQNAFARYTTLLSEQQRLVAQITQGDRTVSPWDPEPKRRQLWQWKNRQKALDIALGRTFAEAVRVFQRALGYDPANEVARNGLAQLYDSRIELAQQAGDVGDVVYFSDLRRELWPVETPPPGRLTIRSHPEGAELFIFSSDELEDVLQTDSAHRLGTAPVHDAELMEGGYLLVARLEGYRETSLPVVVKAGASDSVLIMLSDWSADIPFVGRSEEFDRLKLQLRYVAEQKQPRVVLVSGGSGSGRVRLIAAFDDHLAELPETHLYFYTHCQEHQRWNPFGAFADLIRFRIGIGAHDPPDVVSDRLLDFVALAISGNPNHTELRGADAAAALVLAHKIGQMPGIDLRSDFWGPVGDGSTDPSAGTVARSVRDTQVDHVETQDSPPTVYPAARDTPPPKSERLVELANALAELARLLSKRFPLVLVLRDAHWMDCASRSLLEMTLGQLSGCPILVIASTNNALGGGRLIGTSPFHERITLGPFRREAVAQLMREVLKAPVSDDLAHAVHRYTGGDPYAVEQVMRTLLDGDHLERKSGTYVRGSGAEFLMHGAFDVQQSVLTRLDALEVGVKSACEAAAIVGRVFWIDALAAAGVADAAACVAKMAQADLVVRQPVSTVGRRDEYKFKVKLVWNAIVETMPTERKRKLHGLIVDWLDEHLSAVSAYRARRAYHLAELGRTEEAAHEHELLGDKSMELGAYEDAAANYLESTRLVPVDVVIGRCRVKRLEAMLSLGALPHVRAELSTVRLFESALDAEFAERLAVVKKRAGQAPLLESKGHGVF